MNTLEDPSKSGMELRVLLVAVLSMFVLFSFQFFFPPPVQPLDPVPEAGSEESTDPRPVIPPSTPLISRPDPGRQAAAIEATQATPSRFTMSNADVELVWSNVRGGLRSVRLLQYGGDDGEALEIIPQGLPDDVTHPLEVGLDGVHDAVLKEAVYETVRSRSGRRLTMRFRKGSLQVDRTIELLETGYQLSIKTDVRVDGRRSPYSLALGAGIGDDWDGGYYADFATPQVVYWTPEEGLTIYGPGDLDDEEITLNSSPEWVAVDSHYFGYALISPDIVRFKALSEKSTRTLEDGNQEEVSLLRSDVQLAPGQASIFFVGPKISEVLLAVDESLPNLIDYGYLAVMVKPLVYVLKAVNNVIGNYGFSIIFLTFLINVVLFPIRYKQMASMKKMSAVQPKLKAIQDKFKRMKRDDPRKLKMNEEVMALYKAEGVNPLAGCLPLVVQMPFLFAFYRMLALTMELRGAPFILWIQDLSKADPYYVTPIVMGATMVLQQKMTPMAGDPMQRRMMMFMPVVFTILFLSVSSGLAIYFLFSNVFGMLFQYGFKQLSKEEPPKPSGKPKGKKKKKK